VQEASWPIANGESLAYVKDQSGHHSIQITVDTYGHLIPGANREALNRLNAMVENPQPIRNQDEKRGQAKTPNPLKRLVGHEGFDPSTSRFVVKCSIQPFFPAESPGPRRISLK
jgi:hypothetical protein